MTLPIVTPPPVTPVPEIVLAVGVAGVLDWTVRELPDALHPVAWFGRLVSPLDRDWVHPFVVGLDAAVLLPAACAVLVAGLVVAASRVHPTLAAVAAGLVLFSCTSLRSLLETADRVLEASETDLAAAREQVPALVGRDPTELDAGHLRSAAVESAAENLSDGLVAPLLAFSVVAPFSLAGGAAAATWVKCVNTMDSMLGYPDVAVGTAAAKLDDAVMWLPARVTALLLSAAALSPDPVLTARRWAGTTSSPNAGWPMATAAAALGVRLEKPGAYDLNAVASLPDVEDARAGVRLVGRAGILAYCCAILAGVAAWG